MKWESGAGVFGPKVLLVAWDKHLPHLSELQFPPEASVGGVFCDCRWGRPPCSGLTLRAESGEGHQRRF